MLLHFCILFLNPTSTSNFFVYLESQWTANSSDILCVWKYGQFFTHESNTFLLNKYVIETNGDNTQIDRWDRRQVYSNSAYALLIDSDALIIISPPQNHLGRVHHSCTTMQQSPQSSKFTPKTALPLRWSPPTSNTPIPRPTPLIIPNGIRIQSAVLPQYTFRTDTPTDQQIG